MTTISGVFRSNEAAERAVQDLRQSGVRGINLIAPGAQTDAVPTSETEQPGMGRTVGTVVGAALGIAGGFEIGTAAAAGAALEEESTVGLPEDELYVYKDALRQGRTVLFVQARDTGEAARVRNILDNDGAETIDAARDAWWIGLRSAEKEHYHSLGRNFARDEKAYRRGFEAALRNGSAPDPNETEAFRRGYERGKSYRP